MIKQLGFLLISLFLFSLAGIAQDKPADYSGAWILELTKSELPEMMRIESMNLDVVQSSTDLKVKTTTKRMQPPGGGQGGPPGGGQGGGRGPGGGRMMLGGDGENTYTFDGKETSKELQSPTGETIGDMKLKVEVLAGGKLKLTTTRKISTQMGELEVNTTETWELADNGTTLKVDRTMTSPRGDQTMKLVFAKVKSSSDSPNANADQPKPKVVETGVINGKAIKMALPTYPAEAKEKGIGGVVKVRVMLDEDGNVTSAEAIEGDPLLRKPAVDAAMASKFRQTLLGGVAYKTRGTIVYNFTPGPPTPKKEG
jgi:TonB family protein